MEYETTTHELLECECRISYSAGARYLAIELHDKNCNVMRDHCMRDGKRLFLSVERLNAADKPGQPAAKEWKPRAPEILPWED
jgi:hypothetical protein